MPSANKTTKLQLSQYAGTDVQMRVDYNTDMQRIDDFAVSSASNASANLGIAKAYTDNSLQPIKDVSGIIRGDGKGNFTEGSAIDVSIMDSGLYFQSENVEGALQEVGQDMADVYHWVKKNFSPRVPGSASGDPVATITDSATGAEFNSVIAKGRTTETGSGVKSSSNPYILSGESPTNIKICQRNLINKTAPFDTLAPGVSSARPVSFDATNDLIVTQGQSGVIYSMSQVIVVKPNTTLYFSADVIGRRHRIVFFREDGSLIEAGGVVAGSSYNKVAIDTQASRKLYLDIMFTDTAATTYGLRNVMLTYDQSGYEPYEGQTVSISPSSQMFDGDYYESVSGVETHTKLFKILDNTGTWALYKSNHGFTCFTMQIPGTLQYPAMNCSHFECTNFDSDNLTKECAVIIFTTLYIVILSSKCATTTDLLNWFTTQKSAGTPVTVLYESGSQTTMQHSKNNIMQPTSLCNITADGAPISVDYTVDISSALASKVDKTQESWTTPNLINGWVQFNAAINTVGYYKDSIGIVHLRGLVKGGAASTVAFTLPAGYRPSTNIIPGGLTTITPGGDIYPTSSTYSSYISLDCISFRAEQ